MEPGDDGRVGTRAIVEAAGECFNTRDYEGLDAVVAVDMVNNAAGPQGREGWKQVWGRLSPAFPTRPPKRKRFSSRKTGPPFT